MLKKCLFFLLAFLLVAPCNMASAAPKKAPRAAAPVKKQRVVKRASPSAAALKACQANEPREVVQKKLDHAASVLLARVNSTICPNRSCKQVARAGSGYRAWFQEADPNSLRTELRDSPHGKVCNYVGYVIYNEYTYESFGKTREEALNGPYRIAKTRKMRELSVYDKKGLWQF